MITFYFDEEEVEDYFIAWLFDCGGEEEFLNFLKAHNKPDNGLWHVTKDVVLVGQKDEL